MIKTAEKINKNEGLDIEFKQGDATDLEFENNSFAYALFSFNGLMQIPKRANRIKAMTEISRVLKPEGIFIFTTHDREANEEFFEFWQEEKKRWEVGEQDPRLYEFGDRIANSKHEKRNIFIHIPDRKEVLSCLEKSGFQHVEDFYREDQFKESKEVQEITSECRFWVVRKGVRQ
jgi:ubiquinone/menaquinone biosynthesis C-methylase UbiE